MVVSRQQLQPALKLQYDRVLFGKDVLMPIFGSGLSLNSSLLPVAIQPNKSESAVIAKVGIYGNILLDDKTEVTCYEILLQPKVRIENSRVAIQQYVRKLLYAGQVALINFTAPINKEVWRLTLVAKDSEITEKGLKEKTTNAKRYTYLLGPSETCKTASERFEILSAAKEITFQTLVDAFSVEKLTKAFFDEYTLHYQKFCDYLQDSNFRKSVFGITIPPNATIKEKEKACKPIRDFTKKLLGRIVFLYFVQKKGWLGATSTEYKDGLNNFIKLLFQKSGGNDAFYSNWLSVLFFETLNKERPNADFTMPDGHIVKIPFLNGGLFEKDEFDEKLLTFKSILFHHAGFEDTILTEKTVGNSRGFLDFLDAFNFTVYEDSPDDHTVAVDPEMLGHIFENLLEDNKDKGAFYTPKEIVHYMCQESLAEYLCTKLRIIDEVAERGAVNNLLKNKTIDSVLKSEIETIEKALDDVKICDPAIGSGAFPMGLLQEIFSVKELIAYETGKEWKPAETKLNIIQKSIYGVDIEKGAVDIARLRFWLSLVVDEEKPKALPNLDYKIVVGDSLISKFDGEIVEISWEKKIFNAITDASKRQEENENEKISLLHEIADLQKKYFTPTNKNKKKLQDEIRNLKIELLINQLSFNKELYLAKTMHRGGFIPTAADNKFNVERELKIKDFDSLIAKLRSLLNKPDEPFIHFDWKLDFPEVLNPYLVGGTGGFDILIGNPPYISYYGNTGSDLTPEEKQYIVNSYDSVQKESDRINSMNLFTEKGGKLLIKNGNLSFIVNKTMGVLPSYTFFRDYIINNYMFKYTITDLIPFQAIVDCLIFSIKNTFPANDYQFKFHRGSIVEFGWENISTFKKNKKLEFHIPKNDNLLDMIDMAPKVLSDILTINRGVNIGGCFDVFLSNNKTTNKHHKYLSGTKCIKPYQYEWDESDGYLVFDDKKEKELRSNGKTLALGNHERYLQPRLFIPESSQTIMAAYSEEMIYSAYGLLVGTSDLGKRYLKFACGLLNSKLITFYSIQREILRKGNKATPHVGVKGLQAIPIFNTKNHVDLLSKIVDYILFIKTNESSIKHDKLMPTYFAQIIDGIVYEMYLTDLLKIHKREIIKHLGELPEFTDEMSVERKTFICKEVFNRLNEKEHPIRVNLFYMNSIPEIAIIEGKNENN